MSLTYRSIARILAFVICAMVLPMAQAALPNLSINDVSLPEGNSGTTTFTFTVSLTAPAGPGGVTFDIATADGTATAPSDYTAKSLTGQTIPAGSSTYSFSVLVNGDTTVETNETFFVNVTNVTGALVTDAQGLGSISNDDVSIADLAITQSVTPNLVGPGGNLLHTLNVSNNGPGTASTVTWIDTLPAGTSFVSLTAPAGWSCTTPAVGGSGSVQCSIASLAPGSAVFSLSLTADANLAAGTIVVNTAAVTSATTDSVPGNNSASATATVAQSSTTVTITGHTPDPSMLGQGVTVSYAVAVVAPGAGTPTGMVTVSDGSTSCVASVAAGSCTLQPNSAGPKLLTASYSGDASFSASSSAGVAHAVNALTTYQQASPAGGGNILVSFTGGGATCSFNTAAFTNTLPLGGPQGVSFPHGVFDFTLSGCDTSPVEMHIVYPNVLPPDSRYWKYGPTAANAVPHWYVLDTPLNGIQINGNEVRFHLSDGGPGDGDLTINGSIRDPGGPGFAPGIGGGLQPVPLGGGWARLLLVLMMAVGIWRWQVRRARPGGGR